LDAHARFQESPFVDVVLDGKPFPCWKVVLEDLRAAAGIYAKLTHTCLRITEAGRALAKEWKDAIGAVEE
jgi:hypothetical protein